MKRKIIRKIVSAFMCAVMILTITPFELFIHANAESCYDSDYRKWSQGASYCDELNDRDRRNMNSYGCGVVAMSKMIRECGVDTSAGFNPDVFFKFMRSKGTYYIKDDFNFTTNFVYAPIEYANSVGDGWLRYREDCTNINKINEYINAGYYIIAHHSYSKDSGHFFMIDNNDSIANGTLYIYESSSGATSCKPKPNPYSIDRIIVYEYNKLKALYSKSVDKNLFYQYRSTGDSKTAGTKFSGFNGFEKTGTKAETIFTNNNRNGSLVIWETGVIKCYLDNGALKGNFCINLGSISKNSKKYNGINTKSTLYYKRYEDVILFYADKSMTSNYYVIGKVHYGGSTALNGVTKIDSLRLSEGNAYFLTSSPQFSYFKSISKTVKGGIGCYFKKGSTINNGLIGCSYGKTGSYAIISDLVMHTGAGENYPVVTYIQTVSAANEIISDEAAITTMSLSNESTVSEDVVLNTASVSGEAVIVRKNDTIGITQIQNGWGYTSYHGYNGWINLRYCSYLGVLITKPEPPVVKLDTEPDIPATGTITVSWNDVYDAKYYKAVLYNSAGAEVKAYGDLYGTTATFTPQDEGVYTVKVYAQNSMYTSDPGVLAQAITVHGKSKVTYLNYDGTVIGTQDVSYGNSSVAPLAPEREGYSFYGWSDSLDNVKSERTVTAKYTINKYAVKFFDYEGNQIGNTQMVEYHQSATPPEAPEQPGYVFAGWSSEDYKNVYRENKSDTINIYPIYVWENQNLPITCEITEASRQDDGYFVYMDINNRVDKTTRGRAVVCLKTASGKLVYTTESAAFSIPANTVKSGMEVFVPCDDMATKVEVIIIDDFGTSIPISPVVTASINQEKMWSPWSFEAPPATEGLEIDKPRTVYRYQTREISTNSTNTKAGWTLDTDVARIPHPGSLSAWTDDLIDEYDYPNETRKVNKRIVDKYSPRTKYDYFHYKNPSTGRWSPVQYSGFSQYHSVSLDNGLSWKGNSNVSGWSHYGTWWCDCGGSNYWYPNGTHSESYKAGEKTQYQYQLITYTYQFYRWSDWSDWQTTPVTANGNRHVQSEQQYRYKRISVENDSGETRTLNGKLDSSLAGKLINLYVVKYNANSDFTNEYVGQTVIGPDGSYSFTFKLREEPSVETGDMTAYIGVEGSKEMQAVEVYEAPKAIYTVRFYDRANSEIGPNGEIIEPQLISTQYVEEGGAAFIPSTNPEKVGYTFAGWNNTCTNVRSDLEVAPIFVEQQYIVQYIDTRNPENNKIELCTYGTPFISDKAGDEKTDGECDSGFFIGWDIVGREIKDVETQEVTVVEGKDGVTANTVVMAEYETKTYDVTFVGVNGEVLDTVSVEHEGFVEMPELPEEEGVEFIEWDVSEEELACVTDSITVNAVYYFDETTATPEISLASGAYDGTQTVTLSCDTENAVIWYTLDGTDPSENPDALEYTGPITISDTTVLNCFAGSINANDSEIEQACYVIDGNGKLVTVHNTQDADCDMTFIVDSMSDISEEMFEYTGYDFAGFYYDVDCTQSANLSSDTFSSAVELYAKYTIASYSVVFKDEDRVIKSETAEYGSSVTPPDMNDKGDLVFIGWDGGDYEFISEDTELTAVYKLKSEIVNIELNKYNYTLEEGSSFKLNATVTPDDKSDLMVLWISEDDRIASVLDDGTVTANSTGTVKIYAVTEDDSAIAECSVTVNQSPNTSLCFKETATIGLDTDGNLRGIPINNNTVEYVSSQFRNTADYLKFTKADGTVLAGTDKVGTGTTVSLMNGDEEIDTLTIVLTGDINGDCNVNVMDVSRISRIVVKKDMPDYYQTVASDVNGDGKVNNRDAAYLSRYLVGKEVL